MQMTLVFLKPVEFCLVRPQRQQSVFVVNSTRDLNRPKEIESPQLDIMKSKGLCYTCAPVAVCLQVMEESWQWLAGGQGDSKRIKA